MKSFILKYIFTTIRKSYNVQRFLYCLQAILNISNNWGTNFLKCHSVRIGKPVKFSPSFAPLFDPSGFDHVFNGFPTPPRLLRWSSFPFLSCAGRKLKEANKSFTFTFTLHFKSFTVVYLQLFYVSFCVTYKRSSNKLLCLRFIIKRRDIIRASYLEHRRQDNTGKVNTVHLLMVLLSLIQCSGPCKWLKEWNQAYEDHSKLSREFSLIVR